MVFFYPRFYKLFPPMSRWLDEPLKVLLVGVSAQLGTLPLTLYYLHQFPVYFWLSGWVVVLVGAIFLWGGAVLIALDACSQTAADALGWLLLALLAGDGDMVADILRTRVVQRGKGAEVWGWGTAYGNAKNGAKS